MGHKYHSVINFAELQRICAPSGRLPRASTVRRWADRQGIRYKADGNGGVFTTLDAINFALELELSTSDCEPIAELI